MKRLAVLDLGSNTFNLLVIEVEKNQPKIIYESKTPVKIGENSFSTKVLQPKPIERGKSAILSHVQKAKEFNVLQIFGIATSAIRSASNGESFISDLNDEFNLNIEIISGNQEAEYIYYGVKSSLNWDGKAILIDIGGGSNEISIASQNQSYFSKSYDLGVSRIKQKFDGELPLSTSKIIEIKDFYLSELEDLKAALAAHPTNLIIGSAGTFDSLSQIDSFVKDGKPADKEVCYELKSEDFIKIHNTLSKLNLDELKKVNGLPPFRVEFIVYGTLFIEVINELTQATRIIQSPNSLKEGYIAKLLNL